MRKYSILSVYMYKPCSGMDVLGWIWPEVNSVNQVIFYWVNNYCNSREVLLHLLYCDSEWLIFFTLIMRSQLFVENLSFFGPTIFVRNIIVFSWFTSIEKRVRNFLKLASTLNSLLGTYKHMITCHAVNVFINFVWGRYLDLIHVLHVTF